MVDNITINTHSSIKISKDKIIYAKNRDEYFTAIQALDRVLMHGHYFIPQWYSPYNRIAYRKGLQYPQKYIGFNPNTWWREASQ